VPLEASYLAGGALAEGELPHFWTRKPVRFHPDGERWKYWKFGPKGWEREKTLSSGEGRLSPQGTSNLEIDTADHSLEGMPYRYIVEGTVEDIDRQSISATTSVIVHPSSWYIGARSGSNMDTGLVVQIRSDRQGDALQPCKGESGWVDSSRVGGMRSRVNQGSPQGRAAERFWQQSQHPL